MFIEKKIIRIIKSDSVKINNLLIIFLLVFGLLYSSYLYFYLGYYTSVVIVLVTVGFAFTIYILDKSINRRIIFYIWIAIVMISMLIFLMDWVFSMTKFLKV